VLDISKTAESRWMNKKELEILCVETIGDGEYEEFITVLNRLLELPFSYRYFKKYNERISTFSIL
jgi:hypothetical protein